MAAPVAAEAEAEAEVAPDVERRSQRVGSRVRAKALSPSADAVEAAVAEGAAQVPPIRSPNSREALKHLQCFFVHEEHQRSPAAVAAPVKSVSVSQRSPAVAVVEVAAAAGAEPSVLVRSLLQETIWSRSPLVGRASSRSCVLNAWKDLARYRSKSGKRVDG